MILRVDEAVPDDAAKVHSIAWQDSHRAFCSSRFVAQHTPERLYRRLGFRPTGKRTHIAGKLDEIEFILRNETAAH